VKERAEETRIEAILPHRPPFLWIDTVLSVEPGVRCVASKRIDPLAPFFAGHFPGDPILPGVFLVEAAAQTAGVMMGARGTARGSEKRLASINQFKFRKPVHPDAMIEIETRLLVEREGMALVSAVVTVSGEVVATGQLTVVSR
jgi:3-hydroxyacyl-[acyl-carrier-protein] dehydratase